MSDPIDMLAYLVVNEKDSLGDKYKKVVDIINRLRTLIGGSTTYIKKEKTLWKSIDTLWHQLKHTDNSKKEIYEKISYVLDVSPHTVRRIISEIQKNNPKMKNRIDEVSLFDFMDNENG